MTRRPKGAVEDAVARLVAHEPDHDEPAPAFTHQRPAGTGRLTLRALLHGHWRLTLGAVLLVAGVTVAEQAGPRLVVTAVDDGMVRGDGTVITVVAAAYLATVALTVLLQRGLAQVSGRLAARVLHDLRVRVFTHLQQLSQDFYTREKAGVVMTRMTSDVDNLQQLLQDGLAQVAVQGLTMLVITGVLLTLDVRLTLVTVALMIPPLLAASVWFRRVSDAAFLRVRDSVAAVMSDLSESLRGIRVVTAHHRADHDTARHRVVTGHYRDANDEAARATSAYASSTQLVGLLSQAALLAVGGRLVLQDALSLGELVAFFLYFTRFFQPVQLLVQQYAVYQQSRSSLRKLDALLAEAPSVAERAGARALPPVRGELRFQDVSFRYADGPPVLSDVSLTLAPGETVALVGPTGAGKSTLATLLTRSHDATAGRVLVDGVDVREVTLESLRRQICLVPQESFLFAASLRDNLTFGRPDADDAEVRAAVEAVGLAEAVDRLPAGLATPVHERGQSLSAGERQLVALARAFLARPRVLVLDEATANLDLQSERAVERALDVVLQGRTAVLIAHRLSTAMRSDRVVVLEAGRVVEQGTPSALLADGGRFAAMHATWERDAQR